jgi:hypothetical protein
MCLEYLAAGTPAAVGLGCSNGGYLLTIPNLGHVLVLSQYGLLRETDLACIAPKMNPWTRRAILLWLKEKDVQMEIEPPGPQPDFTL